MGLPWHYLHPLGLMRRMEKKQKVVFSSKIRVSGKDRLLFNYMIKRSVSELDKKYSLLDSWNIERNGG